MVFEFPTRAKATGILAKARAFLKKAARRLVLSGALAVPALLLSSVLASAEDRSLKLYFTHTGERATITFKRDGRYDPKGLAQINRFLRDWRKNEPAKMDPRLLDLVWEVYDRSGANDYIYIVSAYRSPATNNMLRGRSRNTGVAKNSQHMLGKAMDFYIPGVKLATLRALAMQMQVGGVGFYPTSGSPFVHLDVGNVRAWPRMSRQELARIFPSGKTMHLPADGRPLPGYDQAVADYRRRIGPKSIEIASTAGDDDDNVRLPRRSALTAMLPTPKSRAVAALELQTNPRQASLAENDAAEEIAAIAIPIPAVRPAQPIPDQEVKTASIGPMSSAFRASGGALPSAGYVLKQPTTSLASLMLDTVEMDLEEDFDAQTSLTAWALSPPGAPTGMMAPLVVSRTLIAGPQDLEAPVALLETAEEKQFDNDRFWSND